eukprot:Lithocolla_globosa_v1_NODE_1603_length_2454_cov_7.712380.p4 type:complete len:107 gc:universal NODE_1603_length_2454_cov_7.712380:1786-2106(+)
MVVTRASRSNTVTICLARAIDWGEVASTMVLSSDTDLSLSRAMDSMLQSANSVFLGERRRELIESTILESKRTVWLARLPMENSIKVSKAWIQSSMVSFSTLTRMV